MSETDGNGGLTPTRSLRSRLALFLEAQTTRLTRERASTQL